MHMMETFSSNSKWYFEEKQYIVVMLNVDWFHPLKDISKFSVGGIDHVVLKLLRPVRFKRKKVIFVGIISNMKNKAPTNNFLKPMVDVLNESWNIEFNVKFIITNKVEVFWVALICIRCDIAVRRKICSFLGDLISLTRNNVLKKI